MKCLNLLASTFRRFDCCSSNMRQFLTANDTSQQFSFIYCWRVFTWRVNFSFKVRRLSGNFFSRLLHEITVPFKSLIPISFEPKIIVNFQFYCCLLASQKPQRLHYRTQNPINSQIEHKTRSRFQ